MCADKSLVRMFKHMLGEDITSCHIFIPNSVNKIHERLFKGESISAEEIVDKHSLYNYYTAFMNNNKKSNILHGILENDKEVYKVIKYSQIKVPEYLKFCPECVREQLEVSGTFCWDRVHQIAPMCVKHKLWIQQSEVPSIFRLSEYNKYIPNNLNLIKKEMVGYPIEEAALEISKRLKRIIEKPTTISEMELKKVYRDVLRKKGFLTNSQQSLIVDKIKSELIKSIPTELLILLGIELSRVKHIMNPLYAYSTNVHPLYHILIQYFLEIDIDNLDKITPIEPNVPCYCLNPLSNHYKRHIIDDIKVHYCYTSKQHMCTFFCCCGFVYTTRLDQVNSSNGTKRGKIKAYGEEYFRKLVELRHLGIKKIARLTGISVCTIRRQIRSYDKYGGIEGRQKNKIDSEHRNTKGDKKKRDYSILWIKKDEKYYDKALKIIKQEIEAKTIPVRITKTRIAKEINAKHAIVYELDKMPKTKQLIEMYQENRKQYMIRKLNWIVNQYIAEEKELTLRNLYQQCKFSTVEGKNLIKETLESIATTKEGDE